MSELLAAANNNRYLWGLSMLGVNVGARAIVGDIAAMHPTLAEATGFKALAVFGMFFMATRDVVVAAVLACCFFVAVFGLFDRRFRFHVLPRGDAPSPSRIARRLRYVAAAAAAERQNCLHDVQK